MVKNQFVILAAGKGVRMGNSDIPKVLVMLNNKPLILHLLHEIEKVNQLMQPVVVVGFQHQKVEGVLGDQYTYALQEDQLGTAHAVWTAKRKIRAENILVLYGDMPFIKAESLRQLIRLHFNSGSKISICTAQVENFEGFYQSLEHYGRMLRDPPLNFPPKLGGERGGIVGVVEYKDANEEQKELKEVNAGIYMFNTQWLWANIEKIKNDGAQREYYLTNLVGLAASQGEMVQSLLIDPKEVISINTKEDLVWAEKILSGGNINKQF
jgi:bifunctional UDP-N-acetylglucosamine pyrophosphorylase/glucosamine-1-phosphate N-acetyltransferase